MARKRVYAPRKVTKASKKYKATPRKSLRAPLPAKLQVKLKYFDTWTLDPAAGVIGTYVFRANDMYDPNLTGIGHQPRGFDQLMTMYDHYVVGMSEIVLTMHQTNAVLGDLRIALTTQDAATTLTNVNDIMEYTSVDTTVLIPSTRPKQLKQQLNVGKFLGRGNILSDSQLKGSASASVAEGVYYHFYYYSESTGVDPPAQRFSACIEYTAYLIEPRLPAQS